MMPYVLLSDLLTFLVMYCHSIGVFRLILHMGLIVCFCKFLLNMEWIDAIAPAMIVLTLSTFMEGFQTVFMRWLVNQNVGEYIGIVIQMLVSGALAIFTKERTGGGLNKRAIFFAPLFSTLSVFPN